jgi:hypothetical protein
MLDTTITYVQLFIIGFGMGIAGPCLLTCTPLVAYVAGRKASVLQGLRDILLFLSGRILAYLFLGYLAGFSGSYLKIVGGSDFNFWLRLAAAVIIILMGIYVGLGRNLSNKLCPAALGKVMGVGGPFILGCVVGLSPCPPLVGLLFEIALISKSGFDALGYTLFFGLGTFVSGLLTLGALSGFFWWLPAKVFHSTKLKLALRIVCALLLVLIGLNLMLTAFNSPS